MKFVNSNGAEWALRTSLCGGSLLETFLNGRANQAKKLACYEFRLMNKLSPETVAIFG